MGQATVNAVNAESDLQLVASIEIGASLEKELQEKKPDVLVDFTRHEAALTNIQTALKHHVACVVGTTGFTESDEDKIKGWCKESGTPVLLAPNFAIGAVLLMKFASEAAKYFDWSEIIELHHDKKIDAPSGTSLRTAKLMQQMAKKRFKEVSGEKVLQGARGASVDGIKIHSVRLPGLIAHQEVLFGGLGETLTLRHDSISRESFMPGVILSIRKIRTASGLVIGLENFL